MSNANFNGDFRSRPSQSFGGASVNLHRDQLIENAASERKKREEARKNAQFAIKFQSHIRGFLARQTLFDELRCQFDYQLVQTNDLFAKSSNILTKLEVLANLIRRLVLFYRPYKDQERMRLLHELLLNNVAVITSQPSAQSQIWPWKYWMKSYTYLCLNRLTQAKVPCEIKDATWILFQTVRSFLVPVDKYSIPDVHLSYIWQHLIKEAKYFNQLRLVVDRILRYIDDGFEDRNVKIEQLFIDLVVAALSFKATETERVGIVQCIMTQLFAGPLTSMFKVTLLEPLCDSLPKTLGAECLLDALAQVERQRIEPKAFLSVFYVAAHLLNHVLDTMSDEQLHEYAEYFKSFSFNLGTHLRTIPNFYFHLDELEDADERTSVERFKTNKYLITFLAEVFALFNEPSKCKTFGKLFVGKYVTESVMALAHFGHAMLLFNLSAIPENRLLQSLTFKASFLRNLWRAIEQEKTYAMFDPIPSPATAPYAMITGSYFHLTSGDWETFLPPVTLFTSIFNYFLQTLDDMEFFNEYLIEYPEESSVASNFSVLPFSLKELVNMSSMLRDMCIFLIELAYQDKKINFSKVTLEQSMPGSSTAAESTSYDVHCWSMLLRSALRLLKHLYARDIRRRFTPENHWISQKKPFSVVIPANFKFAIRQRGKLYREFLGIRHLCREDIGLFGPPIPVKDIVSVTIIQEMPFVVPFFERVKIMQSMVSFEKRENHHEVYDLMNHTNVIPIRRNFIYEDGFEKLSLENQPNLKKMLRIQLFSRLGMEETGIDGGGVFREFLSEIIKNAYDPNRGFFKLTNDRLLYPNPGVELLVDSPSRHYFFIGRLLGKAVYENMLIELPLAPFFLEKLLTCSGSDVEINHLASLDPVLYKNLISLRNYEGDVADLGLDFSVINSDFGTSTLVELKPDGQNIPVTNQNRIEYIHLMADYKLNKQIRKQCNSFKEGFYNVVDNDLIKMFDTNELQTLISGSETPIDLNDLREHTQYSNGYTVEHPVIDIFWRVVLEFSESERRKLLKFITSCSRPPLLGFKDLYPALCIQNAGTDETRLPTASTCMNLLKLPEVYEKEKMKQKLIYSINAGAGFELS